MELQGKVAIITGASSGIGEALALAMARHGCHLVLSARRRERLESLADRCRAQGVRAVGIPSDMSDRAQVQALVAQAAAAFGGLDILVNNAGVGLMGAVAGLDMDLMDQVVRTNLYGPIWAIQAAVPVLRARGGGMIVNVSSVVGLRSLPYTGGYCATKHALNAISDSLRIELQGTGIRVVSAYPGATETEFGDARLGVRPRGLRRHPGGLVSAEVAAAAVLRGIRSGRRDVFVRWQDRLMAAASRTLPGVADLVLYRWAQKWL